MAEKQFGVVKFYAADKNFGFIAPDDGSEDVYVHALSLENGGLKTLHKDQRVEFAAEADRRGGRRLRAIYVAARSGD
jgi:cold shock protein